MIRGLDETKDLYSYPLQLQWDKPHVQIGGKIDSKENREPRRKCLKLVKDKSYV